MKTYKKVELLILDKWLIRPLTSQARKISGTVAEKARAGGRIAAIYASIAATLLVAA